MNAQTTTEPPDNAKWYYYEVDSACAICEGNTDDPTCPCCAGSGWMTTTHRIKGDWKDK